MKLTPLDEFPIHQTPLPMAVTSDRNFDDRYYFNAHDRSGEVFLVTGFGVYHSIGMTDGFATVRHGNTQRSVRFSDALESRSLEPAVGGYRIEVIEPLRQLRQVCEHSDLSMDMTWEGWFEAVLEERHVLMEATQAMLDASRFAQVDSWAGHSRSTATTSASTQTCGSAPATARGGSGRAASRLRRGGLRIRARVLVYVLPFPRRRLSDCHDPVEEN